MPKQKISFKRSQTVRFELETDAGHATLAATVEAATVASEWRRRDYQEAADAYLGQLPGEWADLALSERIRRNQHYTMFAPIAAAVRVQYTNGDNKPQDLDLDPETMEDLPAHVAGELFAIVCRLNPQWAPAPPVVETDTDGEPDPNA